MATTKNDYHRLSRIPSMFCRFCRVRSSFQCSSWCQRSCSSKIIHPFHNGILFQYATNTFNTKMVLEQTLCEHYSLICFKWGVITKIRGAIAYGFIANEICDFQRVDINFSNISVYSTAHGSLFKDPISMYIVPNKKGTWKLESWYQNR